MPSNTGLDELDRKLNEVFEGRTVVVIAHRLALLNIVDKQKGY